VINFSPSEERLLRLLPRSGRRVTTKDLVERFYKGRVVPENSQIVISGIVRKLATKTQRGGRVRVRRSERAGPHPMQVWIEHRGGEK
jgi:hypothetical protein